ncbi:HAD family hydrolase [Agilicoccus flavus]|uniref:HAD family hydrolase n=1 Tax=Agilicoccus flavus TaxID=2775968 RepID=UPI0021F54618|nr:HAD family phosphatase [Agilicoccus flavus]
MSATPSTPSTEAVGGAPPSAAGGDPHELPAAVLWDMDGTLVDTEPYWIEQEHRLVERFGGTWTEADAHSLVGNPLLVSAEYIRAHTPVTLTPLEIVDELQSGVIAALSRRLPWRPGARELLAELGDLGVPCALVTMSWRPMVDALVATLPDGVFAAIVTGDEVTRGKPDPEPYLTAAAALGVDIGDCVAIEDSSTGSASALAAGARTIVVPHVVAVPPADGLFHRKTLEGLRARDLLAATAPSAP